MAVFTVLLALVVLVLGRDGSVGSLNGTDPELAPTPLLPIFRSPAHVPGFLKNILNNPSFKDTKHWFWTNNSKIESKVSREVENVFKRF